MRSNRAQEFRRRALKYLIGKGTLTGGDRIKNNTLCRLLQLDFTGAPSDRDMRYEFYLKSLPKPRGGDFYKSPDWRRMRYEALKLHGARCQCCGSSGPLHVDHIKPRSKFPELSLEISNLQVLCLDCNFGKSAWDDTDWRANTNVIPFPNVMGL